MEQSPTMKDGRTATQPYRVRVGGVWYWVDPTEPMDKIEPGDTVVIYPVLGEAVLAVLQSHYKPGDVQSVNFSTLEDEGFAMPLTNIVALHLAAIDEEQT
jgi:hypothetical protein